MKKLLFAGLAAALCLVGCNKEADVKGLDGRPVEIILSDAATRTVNDGMSTKWENGDALNVFVAPAGSAEYSANAKFEVDDAANNHAKGTAELTADAYDWYLLYPYSSYIKTPANTGSGYIPVGSKSNEKQTQAGLNSMAHLSGENLPVYGVAKNVARDETPVVSMKHVASVVAINLTNATSTALKVDEVSFTASQDIVGTYYIDFSQETLAFKGSGNNFVSNTASLTVSGDETIAAGASAKFYLAIKPFTAKGQDKLVVKVHSGELVFEKEVTLPTAVEFKSGVIKQLNVTYTGGSETQSSTLAEIVAMDNGADVQTNEVLVVAKYARGIMLAESGSYLLAFNSNGVDGKIGDIVTVSGQVGEYGGFKQIANPEVTVVSSDNEVVLPEPKVIANLDDYASDKVELIQYTGTLAVSGNYFNVNVTGSTRLGSIQYPIDTDALKALDKKVITATGFFTGITGSSTKYVNMMSTSVEEAAVALFGVESEEINVPATATSADIKVTGNVDWTVTPGDGILSVEPLSGTGAGTVKVTFAANTTAEPKEYSVTIGTTADVEDDEKFVTIIQAAASTEAKEYPFNESFATDQGDFTIENVSLGDGLSHVWSQAKYNSDTYMKASAHVSGKNIASESWLISPVVDMARATAPVLSFRHCVSKFFGDVSQEATVWIKEEGGSWNQLTVTYPTVTSGNFSSFEGVSVDVAAYAGKKVQVGFKYVSTSEYAGTWEVTDVKLAEAVTGPVDPTFTAPETLSVEVGKTAKINVTTNSDGAVTYASSNTAVATVAEDGTVTGVAAGTANVTVSAAATANFNAASATVAVTVVEPQTGSHYGKVNTITSGKKYLIAGGNQPRVMVPPTGTTNVKPESADVTINGGKIVSNETTDAYAVTINKNGDEISIILPNGNYLVYAGSSTNLKGSATETDTWTVSEGKHGVFRLIAKSTATASTVRGLIYRAGDSNVFGGYSISNVSGEEYFDIDLYELGAEPTVVSEVVLSSINVSGQKMDFEVGDTFTLGGGIVTATYSDGSTKDVTASAEITAPDLTTAGTKNVTVSYTEKEVTKTKDYQVTVTDGSVTGDKVIIIDGSQLTSDATTADTDKTYSDVTITFSKGAKSLDCQSTATNRFADKAILIGKKGTYIYNKTAIPGKIVKFEVYANKNASTAVTVGINFSDSAISAYNAEAANTFTATLSPDNSVFDCTDKLSENAKYFWFQVTNDKNSQVQFRITYE